MHNHEAKRKQHAATDGTKCSVPRPTNPGKSELVQLAGSLLGGGGHVASEVFWVFPDFLLTDFFDAGFFATAGFD